MDREITVKEDVLGAAGVAEGRGAASRAVTAAIEGVEGRVSLVLTFPTGIDPDRAAVEAAVAAAGAPVAGLTGSGAIAAGGPVAQGCTALAFGPAVEVGTATARRASAGVRAASRSATAAALAELGSREPRVVLLFLDTRSGDQAEAIAGAYEIAGPSIPLAGGAAGGAHPRQIHGSAAPEDAVVAVALATPGPVGIAVANGCHPVGTPSIVTRSAGRKLLELDGEPATDVYLRSLGFGDLELDDARFEALAVTHPIAQPEPSGGARIRHILGREGRALVCATHIPVNAAIEYTREAPDDVVSAAEVAAGEAIDRLGGRPPRAALVFDCAGRKRALAASLSGEIAGLRSGFPPGTPLAGLFTHGEVARLRGAKGDRNHAVVVVAFG